MPAHENPGTMMNDSEHLTSARPFARNLVLLVTGIAILASVFITMDLPLGQQIALVLGLLATTAALCGLFSLHMSREAQREAQRETQAMLDALSTPVYLKDSGDRYRAVNRAWETFFGISRDAVIGKTASELAAPVRTLIERLDASDQTVRERAGFHVYGDIFPLPSGARRDAVVCKSTCMRADGRIAGLVGSIMDITDQKRTERRMMMEHAVTRVLAEAESLDKVVPTIIATICKTMGWHYGALYRYHADEGLLRCEEMWGIETATIREFIEAVGRRSVRVDDPGTGLVRRTFRLGRPVWISDIASDETLRRKSLVIKAGLHGAFAFPLRGGNEVLGILEFFRPDVLQPDAMLLDIAESIGSQIGQYIVRRRAETEKHLAMHDAVTGLPNRLLFIETLEHALVQAQRHQRRLAVMFIDLDRFKFVNDTLGHEAGDMMLKEVSRRLTLSLRQGDTIARLGGDEFVMLLEEITSASDMLLIGQKLITELGRPCSIAAQEVSVTASIGVSTFPADGADSATLLRHADAAMYRAKAKGRNQCQLYSERPTPGQRGALYSVEN